MATHRLHLLKSCILAVEGHDADALRRLLRSLHLVLVDCPQRGVPGLQTSFGLGRQTHVVIQEEEEKHQLQPLI